GLVGGWSASTTSTASDWTRPTPTTWITASCTAWPRSSRPASATSCWWPRTCPTRATSTWRAGTATGSGRSCSTTSSRRCCEGQFEGQSAGTDNLGDTFYFSRSRFAAHTNNVVNYCESHDEQSVPYELQFTPWLDNPAAKERKGRLGMFATLVARGQPMIYMGQEFNLERPRNVVAVDWPATLDQHAFYQWCRRLG